VHDTQERNEACVQELIDRQRPEGGWPFRADTAQTAVEPTALALLALPSSSVGERDAAVRFLLRVQNPNGSWPAFRGDDEEGSGLTGLALYALNRCCAPGMVTNRAVQWLIDSRGWESHWLWTWKFRTSDRHVRFDPDKFGWPWIPETVSWVVPTAYSILALKHSRSCPHDWTDYRHRGHGRAVRHAPPDQHIRAMALLRDNGDRIWMDPSQIGIHRGIDSDARGIQCDSVLVPEVVDDRGGLHLSKGVLETRVSPRRFLFDPLEPVIDCL
jgi:hypothetical protein